MLISRCSEVAGDSEIRESNTEDPVEMEDHSQEYQTAAELFQLMTSDHSYSTCAEPLLTGDLVLLYRNIDIDTQLMTNTDDLKIKRPNQYVEDIIYKDDFESDSDLSQIYSDEDLHNVFMINKERIDFLNNKPSFENTMCRKYGDLEIRSSNLSTDYDNNFVFKDPFIKEQLRTLNLMSSSNEFEGTMLPSSLLDYICCKRLEDNYNFYMDNVIRYVKNTIEQLKRISNGDYLTERAKEKWCQVERSNSKSDYARVLATSTSIPLYAERRTSGIASTWDDIIHSEVDIRSLSKILEKKIVVEIPKLICGSHKLFTKNCIDNLIISCKSPKEVMPEKREESRIDVILQLKRSESGNIMSNINSIMIFQTAPLAVHEPNLLPLPYKASESLTKHSNEDVTLKKKIIELDEHNDSIMKCNDDQENSVDGVNSLSEFFCPDSTADDTKNYPKTDMTKYDLLTWKHSTGESSELNVAAKHIRNEEAVPLSFISSDDLGLKVQRLNMHTSVPEESGEEQTLIISNKNKFPNRIRIKSPYENKTYIMEEKKRNKLLEIRKRREIKKMAMNESCKFGKHKYGKGGIMPQASNSVTKLSISNKSFYNSIYGQTIPNIDGKQKNKGNKPKRDVIPEMSPERCGEESSILTTKENSRKYINRSYYLDDAVTEMMHINMKQNESKEVFSASTSAVSNNFTDDWNIISQLTSSTTNFEGENIFSDPNAVKRLDELINKPTSYIDEKENGASQSNLSQFEQNINTVPANTPKDMFLVDGNSDDTKKSATSLECRKSIDKIYDLMHNIGKIEIKKTDFIKNNLTTTMTDNTDKINVIGGRVSSTVQVSESGTSVRHHLSSSNPSCFSFEKTKNTDLLKQLTKNSETLVPKVIINSKNQIMKIDEHKCNTDRRKLIINTQTTSTDNPLKAISQLLHEFDNVQKIRQKPVIETKAIKNPEGGFVSNDKNILRQNSLKRRSRLDQHLRNYETNYRNTKNYTPKERKKVVPEPPNIPHQRVRLDNKNVDRILKKKMADVIDEAKEARGEAVRGPSKLNSRLNTLAQPKRSYVQAHSEEYQSKYGRNLMADRLQRLAAAPPPILERNVSSASSRGKQKCSGIETSSSLSPKRASMPVPPIERVSGAKRSASGSPHGRTAPELSFKLSNISNTPDLLKKMIAVESYVKNHYRHVSPVISPTKLLGVHNSRAPLIPHDIELDVSSSPAAEESSALGSKLHHIIDTMVNSKPPVEIKLSDLTETDENISKNNTDNLSLNENLSRIDERPASIDSDYPVDVFEDRNIITAVESIPEEEKQKEKIIQELDTRHKNISPFCSTTELEILENALFRQMSAGNFHKRLRIKKLTLTPKPSMQRVLLLQSGDAGSVVVKSKQSQNLESTTSKSENMSDLKILSALSNPRLDWCFAKFPIQVTTIGYAFPKFQQTDCGTSCKIEYMNNECRNIETKNKTIANKDNFKSDKTIQCFKGGQLEPRLERYAQANDNEYKIDPMFNDIHTLSLENNEGNNPIKDKMYAKRKNDEIERNEALDKVITKENLEDTHYTSSLDILVGLLNEIKNISTCQTHITNTVSTENCEFNLQNKDFETILNNATVLESSVKETSHDLVSITSLDKLRQLDSNPSIFSYYISNDGETEVLDQKIALMPEIVTDKETSLNRRVCVDKEVTVDVPIIEYVDRSTDVSSQLFPVTINHTTNVTNSLVGVLSQPSSQSVFYLKNDQDLYSTSSFKVHKKILELPTTVIKLGTSKKSLVVQLEKESDGNNRKISNNSHIFDSTISKKASKTSNHIKTINKCVNNSDFDAVMKIKRDILVAVYSILVFTVFAALSFPDLYRV